MKLNLENSLMVLVVLFATVIFFTLELYWLSILILAFGCWLLFMAQKEDKDLLIFTVFYIDGDIDIIQAFDVEDVKNNKLTQDQLVNVKHIELNK